MLVTALRLLGQLEDAQDASQEVFLKLHRNLGKLERTDDFRSWLYRVTVNVCHDLRRKRPGGAPVEEAEALAGATSAPDQAASAQERRRALDLSLRLLTERERAAVVLQGPGRADERRGGADPGLQRVRPCRSQISQARVKMRGFLERYFRRRT